MQISINPICDWRIYLTASADERLACIMQTSFHSTTSFMDPFHATAAQNRIIANSLHTPQGHRPWDDGGPHAPPHYLHSLVFSFTPGSVDLEKAC